MLYIKRYDLLKTGKYTFKLQYKDEVIWLKARTWVQAEEEAHKIIKRLREENKEKDVAIVWN